MLFVDESGFRPLPAVVRTYAPVGQTPILREWLTWEHLSAISAITPAGELYLQIQDHAFKSPDVVGFLQHLLEHIPGKLLVVWDGISTHRSRAVKDYLSAGAAQRVWLEQLPGYAPELDPVTVYSGLERRKPMGYNRCRSSVVHLPTPSAPGLGIEDPFLSAL